MTVNRKLDLDNSWMDYANCLGCDPALFFPERGDTVTEAKSVCAGCVVRDDCLDYALRNNERHGVWGGLSERERRRVRRERALARGGWPNGRDIASYAKHATEGTAS